jgi:hypothetical protein
VAVRSKAQVCSRSIAGIAGSKPTDGMMFVCCVGNGFCDGLITHSEESYQVCVCVCVCLIVCDLETSALKRSGQELG